VHVSTTQLSAGTEARVTPSAVIVTGQDKVVLVAQRQMCAVPKKFVVDIAVRAV
jgi:hypothetical protein